MTDLEARIAVLSPAKREFLLRRLRDVSRATGEESLSLIRRDPAAPIPLSFAQERLWFLEQLGGVGSAYYIPWHLRLTGALDIDALRRALDTLVVRHEALRTTFIMVDGVPRQQIAPAEESAFTLGLHDLRAELAPAEESAFTLGLHDLRAELAPEAALRHLSVAEAQAPFDLVRGPLIRGQLIRLGEEEHALLITMHHIVSDGWSMGIFLNELSELYDAYQRGEADSLLPLAVQYADYAVWQRAWITGNVLEEQVSYWRTTLAGVPELLKLPTDHPRPAERDYAGGFVPLVLDAELTAGLKSLSQRHRTTLFQTLLAGWAAVLGRLSGQEDLVIGTPTANRNRTEVEGLIGFFVNTLALRVNLSGTLTVAELLQQVKTCAIEAQAHEALPFERVVELVQPMRSLAHSPLFQVMFAWQNMPPSKLMLPGLQVEISGRAAHATVKFDFSLTLQEVGGRIVGGIEYATALWERATVERYAGYLRTMLTAMVADAQQPIAQVPLLSEAERRQVVEGWNATETAYPADLCVHALVEAQAARTPDVVAVEHEGALLTYRELNARANRLAHHLRTLGVGPDARVAICLERGGALILAILAVLKAGGAYVPLDPAYPAERLRYLLADSGAAVLLTADEARADPGRGAAGVRVLDLARDAGAWAAAPSTDPVRTETGLTPAHLAYVIYTSGSTGRPKGVGVPHRGIMNLLCHVECAQPLPPGGRGSLWTSISFDVSVYEVFSVLAFGGTLCVPSEATRLAAGAFIGWLATAEITSAYVPPFMLPELERWLGARAAGEARVSDRLALRRLLVGVEPIVERLLSAIQERVPALGIINGYGPTEAAVCATMYPVLGRAAIAAPERRTPIGRPVANTQAYVLDAWGAPAPVGVAGELYLGGVQVARGYLQRPGLTADRFVPDPFGAVAGARLYRTGDQVRWRSDGTLEFVGRRDFQVKLRGYRVELGEIDAVLAAHPAVEQAVVLAREDVPGDVRLVAYVVGDLAEASTEVLRGYLSERLPAYMVPAAYVKLPMLPLTANGKVDRKALPAPESDAYAGADYEAPAGEVEAALAAIWATLLHVERVGRRDDFFALGGHSLLAVQLVSRVRQALGVELEVAALFRRPVLAELARTVRTAHRAVLPPITALARRADGVPDTPPALSFAQERLWFLEQLGGLGAAYHIPWGLRLRGALDAGALRAALDALVARHEALRTTFAMVDGVPHQVITPPAASRFALLEDDLSRSTDAAALETLAAAEATAPFDLARGPLIRGRLIRLGAEEHALLVTMHHIVSDGWSMGVFARELSALYTASQRGMDAPLPPLAVQYADYAAWQRAWVTGEVLREQGDYWRDALAGAPERLELPTDHPRPAVPDYVGATVPVVLDAALTAGLKALGQRHGVTLFHVLLAAWAVVLSRLAGQSGVVIGTPTANRGQTALEGLIGFFVNTLAMRVALEDDPTVAALLARVRTRALEAQAHEALPFERVVELVNPTRSLAHQPLFQVLFAWQNTPGGGLAFPGLTPAPLGAGPTGVTAKFDLTLALQERGDRIAGSLEYATALWERETVARYAGYLQTVLAGLVADDALRVGQLPLLSAAERALVVETWNATDTSYPAEACVHELLQAQAVRTPEAIAVVCGDEELTYAALNARANQLAHYLRTAHGVGPQTRVALCLERSVELVVAVFAVLKAGGAYVPLDPSYPVDRLRFMLADSAPAVVLSQQALCGLFASDRTPSEPAEPVVLALDAPAVAAACAAAPTSDLSREFIGLTADQAIYTIYTSGSTGRPKGVVNTHAGVVNRLRWMQEAYGLTASEAVLQKTPLSFDVSVWELFWPGLVGARLVLARPGGHQDPAYLAAEVRRAGVTTLHFVPSMLEAFLAEPSVTMATASALGVRQVFCSGEALPAALVATFRERFPGVALHNLYGPTEAAVEVTAWACPRDAEVATPARIPIGRPVANTRLYVLDAWREPVPVGVAGELCIGGVQVARGYLNRPGLTAERFVPDPFGTAGGRLYRTGDLARWLPSGELEYLGRTDFQVKIRGYRIELGEIEAVLAAHPAVQQAVVVARADGGGEPRLVAYVVGDAPLDAKEMRRAVSERLPEYMIPAGFVRLPALPLTPTGKLDRNALPAPDATSYARREYEAPNGEVEEALASIWTDVLGVERVSRHDDFFAIGGHSLLAVRVISRIADYFGVTAALQTIFSATTIARLAADVEQLVYEDIARMTDEEIDQTRELLLTNTAGRRHGDPDDDDGAS